MGNAELLKAAIERYDQAWERLKAANQKDVYDYLQRAGEATDAAWAVAELSRNFNAESALKRLNKMKQQGSEPDAQARDQSNDQPADQ